MSQRLFSDDEGSDSEPESKGLKVNKKYARHFEEKNRHIDLRRAKDKGLLAGESSDSESEDDDAEALTPKLEFDIMKAISMIRNKDKRIYNDSFRPFDEHNKVETSETEKKQKPLRYKDMVRMEVLKKVEEEEGGLGAKHRDDETKQVVTYDESQKALKDAFKEAINSDDSEDDDDENVLTLKKKTQDDLDKEEDDFKRYIKTLKKEDKTLAPGTEDEELLSSMFNDTPENKNEAFLRKYVLNRAWVDNDGLGSGVDFSDDDEEVEEAETFETQYNFRFEEPGSEKIVSHPRKDETSVRRKESARRRQRLEKKKRKEKEKLQRLEELKRLKNLKRQELERRLKKSAAVAGIKKTDNIAFNPDDLEGDFDPEEWDKKMAATFNDDYYNEQDDSFEPEFIAPGAVVEDDAEDVAEDVAENDDVAEEDQRSKKRQRSKKTRTKKPETLDQDALDELYALDYEDVIAGGLKTRFKYNKVKPDSYGLTTEEIMLADHRLLQGFVSLKQMAPYSETEFRASAKRRKRFRQALKKQLMSEQERREKEEKKLQEKEALHASIAKEGNEQGEEDEPKLKKRKRKRRSKRETVNSESASTNEVPTVDVVAPEVEATKTKKKRKRKRKNKSEAE